MDHPVGRGFVGATFAAKLPFLIFGQSSGPWWATWLGDGKTILWGLMGGYVGVEVGKAMMEVRTRTGDTFVIGMSLILQRRRNTIPALEELPYAPFAGLW